jgi:L-galactose dehydrogenase
MRYRRLGRTLLDVSEISMGAARGAAADRRQFIRTVHAALDAGINLFDTAESYENGTSERVLGKALAGRRDVIVETKYRPYDSHQPDARFTGTPRALVASAEASLRRLRRDTLDILLGHGIRSLESYDRFMNDGCYEALARLKEAGKVRFIGISELSEADGRHEVLTRAVPSGAFDVVMLTVNFLLQTAVGSVLPLCREHDVGTVVMMPLNQASRESGLVSEEAALECVRRHVQAGSLPDEPPYTDPDLLGFLAPMSIPEAGLRYVLTQDVSTCCVGMRSPERVHENCRITGPPYLDRDRMLRLEQLFGRIEWQVR